MTSRENQELLGEWTKRGWPWPTLWPTLWPGGGQVLKTETQHWYKESNEYIDFYYSNRGVTKTQTSHLRPRKVPKPQTLRILFF